MCILSSYSCYMHYIVFSVIFFTLDAFLCFIFLEITDYVKLCCICASVVWMSDQLLFTITDLLASLMQRKFWKHITLAFLGLVLPRWAKRNSCL